MLEAPVLRKSSIKEGNTILIVPDPSSYTFQGRFAPFKAPVFYNPCMEFSRDLAILVLNAYSKTRKKPIEVCDPMAGLGARGVRYAKEVKGIAKSVMGDLNQDAIPIIKQNASINSVESIVEICLKDANLLLTEHSEPGKRFDFIDIDPFGCPVPFLDSAVRALKNGGLLAVTATDTAPLCGVHAKACIRKYGAVPLRTEFCHEIGLRIMIGSVIREALKYEFGMEVLLSYSVDHYFRAYFRARMGAKKGDQSASLMGYLMSCPSCGWRGQARLSGPIPCSCEGCGDPVLHAGPMWLGQLADKTFLELISREDRSGLNTKKRIEKFLCLMNSEHDKPVGFFVLDRISSKVRRNVPPISRIVELLTERGYCVSLTHFHPKAVKTDAPSRVLAELVLMA